MKTYIVNLHAQIAYEYVVEANDKAEAIEKAKHRNETQTAQEHVAHEYDFKWLEPDAYAAQPDDMDYKS